MNLLCRLQGLRLLIQELLHLSLQVIFLVIFELVHTLFQFVSLKLLLLDKVLKLLRFDLGLTELIHVLSLHNLFFTTSCCSVSLLG